jgi:O-succinylbenzoic acid--CoA ligase
VLPGTGAALAWLRGQGVGTGARVGLLAANTPATLALMQAAALAGVTVVLFNRRLDAGALGAQVARAALDGWVAAVEGPVVELSGMRRLPVIPDAFADEDAEPAPGLMAPVEPERPALVLFTSGTSGVPKAARLSVRALAAAARAAAERLRLGAEDTWVACLGLDHIGGASFAWRAGMCGHRLALVERFAAAAVNAEIDRGATGISVVPTMLHRLLEERGGRAWPAALRVILTGGGPLSDALAARSAAAGREPSQTYGLSECASQVCTAYPGAVDGRGTAGVPLPGIQVRLVDGGGAQVAEGGVVGQIEVRGPVLFSGYEDGGALPAPQAPDRWFATGDLGSFDLDGRLTIHCRRTDLIVSGGENVYPAEIEAALEEHPAVRQAAVWGEDDEEWGQVVTAALVVEGAPDAAGFAAWMAARLPGFQRPRRWAFVAELPVTANGKLARARLPGWLDRVTPHAPATPERSIPTPIRSPPVRQDP